MTLLITALYVMAALLGASFAVVELRLIARFLRHRAAVREAVSSRCLAGVGGEDPDNLPTVTIQLPLYNELYSAERVIRASAAQTYPRDRFDIQVLDDSTDETSELVARVVADLQAEGVRIEHIRRPHRVGYKAGALAEGLARSDAEFVAVFDADFVPPPGFLHRILAEEDVFDDPTVAFVQTRWAWDAPVRGLIASGFSLLMDRHFFVQKPTRVFLGDVTTFNGSAGVWRRAAIDDAGGWSADTLTEDLDLSYRCAMKGWRGHYLQDLCVSNELPEHMRAFKLQQRRWARGSAQCLRKLASKVWSSRVTLRDPMEEVFLLGGYMVHPILLANVLLWPAAVLYMNRTVFLILQGVMSSAFAAAVLSLSITSRERDGRWRLSSLGEILAGMCVGLGLMVNNTVAQLQGLLPAAGEFARTPKGVRRAGMSRIGVSRAALYRSPLHWTFFLEVAVVAYCLMAGAMLIAAGEGLWAFPLFFWGLCIGLVVQMQMVPQPIR